MSNRLQSLKDVFIVNTMIFDEGLLCLKPNLLFRQHPRPISTLYFLYRLFWVRLSLINVSSCSFTDVHKNNIEARDFPLAIYFQCNAPGNLPSEISPLHVDVP